MLGVVVLVRLVGGGRGGGRWLVGWLVGWWEGVDFDLHMDKVVKTMD